MKLKDLAEFSKVRSTLRSAQKADVKARQILEAWQQYDADCREPECSKVHYKGTKLLPNGRHRNHSRSEPTRSDFIKLEAIPFKGPAEVKDED